MFTPTLRSSRATLFAALMLLAATVNSRPSRAIQLRWSSGSTDLCVPANSRVTLIVHADSTESILPNSWRLQWTADSSGITFAAPESTYACLADTAKVESLDPPLTPADSAANLITAHFCSYGQAAASVAFWTLELVGGSKGKLRVVALDPADPDSSTVLESNEVTFNGGIDGDYAPLLLRAYVDHPGADLTVTVIGAGLSEATSLTVAAPDTAWQLPLSVTERSATRATGRAYLSIPLPGCTVDIADGRGASGTVALAAEVPLSPMAPVGSSATFVPAYGIVQPKDFAFYYQQQLGIFHVFYIVSNRVILGTTGYGADSTEKCIGHAWSTDLEHWTSMDSVLTIRSDKWDNAHIWAPTIVQKDLQFKLFYTGVHRDALGRQIQMTGLATADATLPNDSLKTWTRSDSAVFYCRMVPWANKNTSAYEGQQFLDPFVVPDPDSVGRYLMYYVTIHKNETAKMVVGLARSSGDLSVWRNYGPMHGTEQQYTGSTNNNVESPNLFQHYDVASGTMSRWLFLTTNTGEDVQQMHFQRTLGSPSDMLAGPWLPTTDLYSYLGGDSTVSYWHATEYLPVPARIGGYVTTHEFLAAFDDFTWGIDVNEIRWNANPVAPYYADFTLAYPSLTAVGPGIGTGKDGTASLLLLGRQPVVREAYVAVDLLTAASARVVVLDIQGRNVRTLARGVLPVGRTIALWDGRADDGRRAPNGVYFVRLTALGLTRTARLVLLH